MATRTSSPPGSRSKAASSRSSSRSSKGRSTSASRSRSTTKKKRPRTSASRRRAPRAVRSGRGPVLRGFSALGRGAAAIWLGLAHAVGAIARRIGKTARDLEPEHRRDGVGLFLFGLAVICAAAVWWQLPGGLMHAVDTVVAGSFGKVGWLVPLMLVWIGWRNLRDPETNGPAGRQVVGWVALAFGVLGVVQIAAGNPQPVAGDASDLQSGGGAIGYVVSSLLLDLLRTPYVVVPLLLLLSAFGVLVITSTPVYQVPVKLRALRDRLLGRTPVGEDESDLPTQPVRSRRVPTDDPSTGSGHRVDPDMGDPAYDSPVLSDRELRKRKRGLGKLSEGTDDGDVGDVGDDTSAIALVDTSADTSTELVPPPHAPLPQRVEQLELSGDVVYHLPANEVLKPGLGPQGPLARQRRRRRSAHAGARRVRYRRAGHRLHPRPDGHPLRGRGRPGREGREGHRAVEEHRVRRCQRRRADPQPRSRASRRSASRSPTPTRRSSPSATSCGATPPAPTTTRWWSGSARTSRAASSSPTSPRCPTCWSPAPPAPASRASSTR